VADIKLSEADLKDIEGIADTLIPKLRTISDLLQAGTTALKGQGTQLGLNKEAVNEFISALKTGQKTQEALAGAVNKALAPYRSVATAQDKINLQIKTAKSSFTEIIDLLKQQGLLDAAAAKNLSERVDKLKAIVTQEQASAAIQRNLEKKVVDTKQETRFSSAGLKTADLVSKTSVAKGGKDPVLDALVTIAAKLGFKLADAGGKIVGGAASGFATGVKEKALAVNDLTTGFSKLTGQIFNFDFAVATNNKKLASFAQQIIMTQNRNQKLGVTIEGVKTAYTDLITESRAFGEFTRTGTTPAIRKKAHALAELAVQFGAAGIDTKNFGGVVETLGKTFKVTDIVTKTRDWSTRLVNLARATGQTSAAVAKDFGASMEYLAAYPLPKAQKQFEKLSIISAATGVSVANLLKTAGGFDDMEKAAGNVGELNAMLGGPYLNTLDMVNATEAKRITMLQESMVESGQSWNTMDRFMKKAIASAAGMSLVDAARAFGHEEGRKNIESTINLQKDMQAQLKGTTEGYDDMFGFAGKGAARNAVALKEQLAATKEAMSLEERAYRQMEEISFKAMQKIRVVAMEVREFVAQTAIGGLMELNKAVTTMHETMTTGMQTKTKGWQKEVLKQLLALPGTMLEASIRGATGEIEGPTVPGLPEDVRKTDTATTRSPLSQAKAIPLPTKSAAAPTGKTPAGPLTGGQELALTQNIVLKLDGDVLHEQVTKSLERYILPGVWS